MVVLDDRLDQQGPHIQGLGADTATKRTLRRTPRSWSLREAASQNFEQNQMSQGSPTLSAESVAAPATVNPAEDENMDALPSNYWERQVYPLQSTMTHSTMQRTEELPTTRELGLANWAISDQIREGSEASPEGFSLLQQVYPTHPSISNQPHWLLSVREPGNETEHAIQTPARQALENGQAGEEGKLLSRQRYPLQMAAGSAELPLLPTPPSPSGTDLEDANNMSKSHNSEYAYAGQGTGPLKPRAYPLQAAVSVTNLRRSQTPPSTWDEEQESRTKEFASQAQQDVQAAKRVQSHRRNAYPLQSPASVLNLKGPTTPQPSVEEGDSAPGIGQASEELKPRTSSDRTKVLRRQAYPLQSPASLLDLRNSTELGSSTAKVNSVQFSGPSLDDVQKRTQISNDIDVFRRQIYPLQPPSRVTRLERSSELPSPVEESGLTKDFRESWTNYGEERRTINKTNPISRQFYPLQSPASIPALRLPPSPSPSPPPSTELELQDRKKELASNVIKHWRRQVYPLQSPDSLSVFQRATTPQPPEPEMKRNHNVGPIHLPKNIRAVTDAEKPGSGGRTIVVCLDGTGDKFDGDNSNIVHLISALKKDDPNQVSYYQAGIGTYTRSGLSTGFSAALDMAVGSELGLHVRDAYHFLMHTYKEGDKICIFGFSRGAYTARCLAGMIHKVGLLPPRNIQQIAFAYEFYANDSGEGWEQSGSFKATFSIDVSVHFLGCFDSVASVGFIPRQLPLSSTPGNKPRYFRHAMALDERRAKFKVCRHQIKDFSNIQKSERAYGDSKDQNDTPPGALRARYGESYHPNVTDEEYERLAEADEAFDTDVLEVWFAGAHADVGGGAVANDERHKLAQIPLRWMIRQAFECNTGIIFKTKKLAEFGLDVHTLWPKYSRLNAPAHGPPPSFLEKYENGLPPRSIRRSKLIPIDKVENGERFYHLRSHTDEDWTPEQVEDFFDAMSPLNDQLVQAPRWWILEAWPVEYKVPIRPGEVEIRTGMNLGRYRGIDDVEPKVHWTVLHRAQHIGYKIQVVTAAHTKWSVVV
jgi:uncharacterized protein (DUF2235 family)